MDSIFKRRSIRNFSDKEVEFDKIERILRAAMQAPSAHNFQPWEFIVVEDDKTKEKIATMSPYASPAKKSKISLVVLANMEKVKKENLWWQQDLGACVENILLQTVEEGLAGVWLGFYPEEDRVEKLRELFSLPSNIVPFAVIAIGYSDNKNKFIDKFDYDKIYFENYKRGVE